MIYHDTPARRSMLIRDSAKELSTTELLAEALNVPVTIAGAAIAKMGGLRALFNADADDLSALDRIGPARSAQLKAIAALARRYMAENMTRGDPLRTPDATRQFLRAELRDEPHEMFCALFLDTRHHVIAFERLFQGTVDATHVHPRVVVERALKNRAASVIVAHNHPSGVAEPSQADLAITRRLRDALALVDIRLLDHFIVGDAEVVSLAERGLV